MMKTEIKFYPDRPAVEEKTEIESVKAKVTDKSLLRLMFARGWSPTAWRQWICEVTLGGKKFIGFNIGNDNYAISADGVSFKLPSKGITLVQRQQSTLSAVTNIADLIAVESQDLFPLPKCDYLILNGSHEREADVTRMFRRLCRKYERIMLFTPRSNKLTGLAEEHLKPKDGGTVEICTKRLDYWGENSVSYLWQRALQDGHKRPKWASCLRCRRFPKCEPHRLKWSFVCVNYAPIVEAGMLRHPDFFE